MIARRSFGDPCSQEGGFLRQRRENLARTRTLRQLEQDDAGQGDLTWRQQLTAMFRHNATRMLVNKRDNQIAIEASDVLNSDLPRDRRWSVEQHLPWRRTSRNGDGAEPGGSDPDCVQQDIELHVRRPAVVDFLRNGAALRSQPYAFHEELAALNSEAQIAVHPIPSGPKVLVPEMGYIAISTRLPQRGSFAQQHQAHGVVLRRTQKLLRRGSCLNHGGIAPGFDRLKQGEIFPTIELLLPPCQ